jgi:glycosyltransferase involved in cell wall biosynthesis
MVGRNPGYVLTQGEVLADYFKRAGFPVISVSSSPNRYVRLADIASTLVRYRHSIDIMIVQVYGGRSFIVEDIASWLGHRFDHRVIMVLRGGTMPEFMSRFPQWTRRVFRRAHAIIAPSEFLIRAIAPYGIQAKLIPNLIDISCYPYRYRETVRARLFWMRSFHPVYNPLMAVRVLAGLRTSFPEASLVMAGQDRGLEREAKRLTETLRLNGAVRFAGFLDMQAKIREGDSADIYLNTNRADNMPVTLIEAGAMGLPMICTSVGGIPYLIKHGETGLLVPDDDPDAMIEAVKHILQEPGLCGRLSRSGRMMAESSSWEHVRPQWEHLFDELMTQAS